MNCAAVGDIQRNDYPMMMMLVFLLDDSEHIITGRGRETVYPPSL